MLCITDAMLSYTNPSVIRDNVIQIEFLQNKFMMQKHLIGSKIKYLLTMFNCILRYAERKIIMFATSYIKHLIKLSTFRS